MLCFFGIFWEIFLAELYGWLTLDERAFGRLYPGNHELAVSPGTVSPRSKEATVSSEITLLLTRGFGVQSINTSFDAEFASRPAQAECARGTGAHQTVRPRTTPPTPSRPPPGTPPGFWSGTEAGQRVEPDTVVRGGSPSSGPVRTS